MADPFGQTWWGRKWWRSLETLGLGFPDPRITKGRAIATRGDVHEVDIRPGAVTGFVAEKEDVYEACLTIPVYPDEQWTEGLTRLALSPSATAALLTGTLSKRSDSVLAEAGIQLIPKKTAVAEKDRLESTCTCTDRRAVCGHGMALALASAAKMDEDATRILYLRGCNVESLPGRLRAARVASWDAAESV
ncbi:SWIM zinc finger family protein [Salininema proteolyticum]|uniref:SWIM-type domain-containing protein n=1 Tax=Salininema proteolyticum TaxID=1607685 RepID=A0ABV8TUM1_9ACTN